MKTLNANQTQRVSGGLLTLGIDNKQQGTPKVEPSAKTSTGITVMTFNPSHPEGVLVRLNRFDAIFMAPSESLGEETSQFPGLNDQGGVV